MEFKLQILGSAAAMPTSKRNPSAQLLSHLGRAFLIDCAEGTQMQLRRNSIRFSRISHIFISHLHGDHYFGLIGLLFTYHLLGRTEPLHLFAKKELEDIILIQLKASATQLIYPLIFHRINPAKHEKIWEDEKIVISTIPLIHSIPTCGFLFKEKPSPRKIRKDFLLKHDIPLSEFAKIKAGNDYICPDGKLFKNNEITSEASQSCSYAYCSDTLFNEDIVPIVNGVNVLYHEATFMNNLVLAAREKFHSTASQAAAIAKKAGVGKLIIGHFSARYDNLEPLLAEAKTVFENTIIAEDGMEVFID